MARWRTIGRRGAAVALGVLLLGTGAASSAAASTAPAGEAPAQYYGGWGGWPGWGGWGGLTYASPDWSSPYAGSPGYPYYRYGANYGSAFGLPYPTYPSYGAYYSGPSVPAPLPYSSAGGVSFGYGYGGYGGGQCFYSAMAGVGGGWSDPQSYGYVAPFC
jgi:hypothetical protein